MILYAIYRKPKKTVDQDKKPDELPNQHNIIDVAKLGATITCCELNTVTNVAQGRNDHTQEQQTRQINTDNDDASNTV